MARRAQNSRELLQFWGILDTFGECGAVSSQSSKDFLQLLVLLVNVELSLPEAPGNSCSFGAISVFLVNVELSLPRAPGNFCSFGAILVFLVNGILSAWSSKELLQFWGRLDIFGECGALPVLLPDVPPGITTTSHCACAKEAPDGALSTPRGVWSVPVGSVPYPRQRWI